MHEDNNKRATQASRRKFLKAGAGLAAGAAAAEALPSAALAQGGPADAELSRVQAQRRIVLKGGLVLSLDRQVGDFAQADVLIEDGKIREVRPNIEVSADAAAIVDASSRIIVPGFVDTHSHSYQGILRNILSNGRVDPDYNRDIIGKLTPVYTPDDAYIGMLATALGMIEMGTTGLSTCRRSTTRRRTATQFRHPRGVRLFERLRPRRPASGRTSPA